MRKPHVLLMIESSRGYGRGCLRGVARYLRNYRSWIPIPVERGLADDMPACLKELRVDGVLARIELPKLAEKIAAMGVPVVDLRNAAALPSMAIFDTDPALTSRLAADHLMDRGFRHLAYCGFPGVQFSDERCTAFLSYLGSKGLRPSIYEPPFSRRRAADAITVELRGSLQVEHIAGWIASLPRPLGLMACNDARGRQVLEACYQRGIKVPEEVAVIGVDNDEVICELSVPPLSSVEPDSIRIGFEGAELIDRMMLGERPPPGVKLYPPTGVVTRMSSDILAIGEPTLVNALHFIREHAHEGIDVNDVLERMVVSRSTLERLFRKWLGRTPKEEIQRLRIESVKQLLLDTDYTLWTIARLTGFQTEPQLIVAFKALVGQTPGRFRQAVRSRR
jgi:LacI family transcriptional regulator